MPPRPPARVNPLVAHLLGLGNVAWFARLQARDARDLLRRLDGQTDYLLVRLVGSDGVTREAVVLTSVKPPIYPARPLTARDAASAAGLWLAGRRDHEVSASRAWRSILLGLDPVEAR